MNSKFLYIAIIVVVVVAVAGLGYMLVQSNNNPNNNSTTPVLNTSTAPTVYPLTITDADGRNVTFYSPPTRIVAMSPAITEDVFSLNLAGSVVGVDNYSDYPPQLLQLENSGNITTCGGYTTPDIEQIASLNPQVVFLDQSLQDSFVSTLANLNITVVVLSGNSISDVEHNLILIGQITNHTSDATTQVDQINNTINYVEAKLQNVTPVPVMELAGPPEDGMWSAANGTFINQIMQIAGGTNIFGNYQSWYEPSGEDVINGNPQFVIMDSMELYGLDPQSIISYFNSQPGFSSVSAVQNNHFYIVYGQAGDTVERAGPRISDAILMYAEILHPNVFNVTNIPTILGDNYTDYINTNIG